MCSSMRSSKKVSWLRASLGLKPPGWVRPKLAAVRKGCLAVACLGGCEEDPAAPPAASPAASSVAAAGVAAAGAATPAAAPLPTAAAAAAAVAAAGAAWGGVAWGGMAWGGMAWGGMGRWIPNYVLKSNNRNLKGGELPGVVALVMAERSQKKKVGTTV